MLTEMLKITFVPFIHLSRAPKICYLQLVSKTSLRFDTYGANLKDIGADPLAHIYAL